MKWLFLIWFLLIALFSKAQNGGQFAQNDVIIVSYLGFENNTYVFKITNKLDCDIEVRYRFEQFASVDTIIPKSSSIYTPITSSALSSFSFTVKPIPQTVCILGGSKVDMGLLEINFSPILLFQPNNFIRISPPKEKISVQLHENVLKTNLGNNIFPQSVTIYDFNGRILFKDRRIVNKQSTIFLNKELCKRQNFILVHIENKSNDVFLLKIY